MGPRTYGRQQQYRRFHNEKVTCFTNHHHSWARRAEEMTEGTARAKQSTYTLLTGPGELPSPAKAQCRAMATNCLGYGGSPPPSMPPPPALPRPAAAATVTVLHRCKLGHHATPSRVACLPTALHCRETRDPCTVTA
ncbi:hypothetical protein BS78_06G004800 [Paspalum vaginatum]|nr:hypothetical protein BS78_06G004800 [Paspalum vaginatum]